MKEEEVSDSAIPKNSDMNINMENEKGTKRVTPYSPSRNAKTPKIELTKPENDSPAQYREQNTSSTFLDNETPLDRRSPVSPRLEGRHTPISPTLSPLPDTSDISSAHHEFSHNLNAPIMTPSMLHQLQSSQAPHFLHTSQASHHLSPLHHTPTPIVHHNIQQAAAVAHLHHNIQHHTLQHPSNSPANLQQFLANSILHHHHQQQQQQSQLLKQDLLNKSPSPRQHGTQSSSSTSPLKSEDEHSISSTTSLLLKQDNEELNHDEDMDSIDSPAKEIMDADEKNLIETEEESHRAGNSPEGRSDDKVKKEGSGDSRITTSFSVLDILDPHKFTGRHSDDDMHDSSSERHDDDEDGTFISGKSFI